MQPVREKRLSIEPSLSQEGNHVVWKNAKPPQCLDSTEKVRYLPSEIKVSKTVRKRASSAMCSFTRKQQTEKSKEAITEDRSSVSECEEILASTKEDSKIKQAPLNSNCGIIAHSDVGLDSHSNMDDVMSTVSDLSDLSVMSLGHSKIANGSFRHPRQAMDGKTPRLKRTQSDSHHDILFKSFFSSQEKGDYEITEKLFLYRVLNRKDKHFNPFLNYDLL